MKNTKKLRLKQRDIAILKLLYEHRFLDTELLWHLLKSDSYLPFVEYTKGSDGKSRPITYGFKKQALSKRLKQLFDADFVERHYITDQPLGRGFGAPRAIYGLGKNSPTVLNEADNIPIAVTRKIIQSNKVKSPFLRHALELARFKVILILACRMTHQRVKLMFWKQGESIRDYVDIRNKHREIQSLPIHADAFFALELKGTKTKHFFLEIDRGTEPIVSNKNRSSIRKKLIAYQYYKKSKKVRVDDIKGFQVLFVTIGQLANKNRSNRISNIIEEILIHSNIYTSKSLFYFTTFENLLLENPKLLLSNIWISPFENSLLSIVE